MAGINNGADSHSKTTAQAGLPKECLLATPTTVLGGAAGIAAVLYDVIAFNYGAYTFTKTGAFFTGVIIPEPGLYSFGMQIGVPANTQTTISGFRQNGNQVFRDGVTRQNGEGQNHGTGGQVAEQTHGVAEMMTGDILDTFWAQPAGVPFNGSAGYFWMYVKKEGGRY